MVSTVGQITERIKEYEGRERREKAGSECHICGQGLLNSMEFHGLVAVHIKNTGFCVVTPCILVATFRCNYLTISGKKIGTVLSPEILTAILQTTQHYIYINRFTEE